MFVSCPPYTLLIVKVHRLLMCLTQSVDDLYTGSINIIRRIRSVAPCSARYLTKYRKIYEMLVQIQ